MKEGLSSDTENAEAILKLTRYLSTFKEGYASLDEYLRRMKKEQTSIYFIVQ